MKKRQFIISVEDHEESDFEPVDITTFTTRAQEMVADYDMEVVSLEIKDIDETERSTSN